MERFNVSNTVALLPPTLYVIALGLGSMLAAPLSGSHGRHIVSLTPAPPAALFPVLSGVSQGIQTLCILRFFSVWLSPLYLLLVLEVLPMCTS